MSKLSTERIDQFTAIRPMSHNLEDHEDRMKAACDKVKREYFDKGLNHAGRPKKA